MVVMEVAEEHDVDPVDAELALQRLDAVEQDAPPRMHGVGGPLPILADAGRGVEAEAAAIAVVDDQRLAAVAEHKPRRGLGMRLDPDVVGDAPEPVVVGRHDQVAFQRTERAELPERGLQCGEGSIDIGEDGRAEAREQRVRLELVERAGRPVRVHRTAEVVVVVLERGDARHAAGRVDRFAGEDHGAVGCRQRIAGVVRGDAGEGDDLEDQAPRRRA